MDKWGKALTYIMYVGQLGLDLMMPVLLCVAGCYFLNTRYGVGSWIYIPGFFFGLGAGFITFWKFYTRVVMKGLEKTDKDKRAPVSYSKHE
ncbi:AtpZ/AtpI family protein [Butyrivibrio sp. MC2013]|uniref:AtpZ/AtpI family protein n=1 Tax=Butyrivibrio sp. MC2013 TaxID=1280686 RepID=UPI000408C4A4|nr:AtpZ/AtpI family protein [Butyrivibrio sp. MC2013]